MATSKVSQVQHPPSRPKTAAPSSARPSNGASRAAAPRGGAGTSTRPREGAADKARGSDGIDLSREAADRPAGEAAATENGGLAGFAQRIRDGLKIGVDSPTDRDGEGAGATHEVRPADGVGGASPSSNAPAQTSDAPSGTSAGEVRNGSWTDRDRSSLAQAVNAPSDPFGAAMVDWKQGENGNCAAIATIKAAMDRDGNQVFDSIRETDDGGYRIGMQDGVNVSLSGREMDLASRMSDFRGDGGPAQAYATLAYAAIGKRAQMENGGSYGQNLASLNNGYDPYKTARYLGLKDRTVPVDPQTLSGRDAVVAWSPQHAVYVNREWGGQAGDTSQIRNVSDVYGTRQTYRGQDGFGRAATKAFTLAPRAYPSQRYGVTATAAPGRPRGD